MTENATLAQKIAGQFNSLLLPAAISTLLNFKIAYYDRSVDPAPGIQRALYFCILARIHRLGVATLGAMSADRIGQQTS